MVPQEVQQNDAELGGSLTQLPQKLPGAVARKTELLLILEVF